MKYGLKRGVPWVRLLLFVAFIAIAAGIAPGFNHAGMYFNILTQASLLGIQSLGILFVLIAGYIDFSIGAQTALYGIFCAILMRMPHLHAVIAILGTLLFALLVGALHGWLIYTHRLHSMISTIGVTVMLSGVSYILADGLPIFKIPEALERGAAWHIWRLSCSSLTFALLAVLAAFILAKTYWGKFFYAIGCDETAAARAGVPVRQTCMVAFALSSLFCAIGAIVYVGRIGVASPNGGDYFIVDVLTVIALGGVGFSGGKGKVLPVVCAALFLTMLTSAFVALHLASYYQNVIKGAILFLTLSTKMVKS